MLEAIALSPIVSFRFYRQDSRTRLTGQLVADDRTSVRFSGCVSLPVCNVFVSMPWRVIAFRERSHRAGNARRQRSAAIIFTPCVACCNLNSIKRSILARNAITREIRELGYSARRVARSEGVLLTRSSATCIRVFCSRARPILSFFCIFALRQIVTSFCHIVHLPRTFVRNERSVGTTSDCWRSDADIRVMNEVARF